VHRILEPGKANQISSGLCGLAIMTKAPLPGKVKTRLVPPLTPEQAAQLNVAFLQDLSRAIQHASEMAPALGVAVYTPAGAEATYKDVLPDQFLLLRQRGHDFGQRLILAAEDLFAVGFGSMCLINSDSPTVPAYSFAQAALELAHPGDRVVLGPADDGGYYLIGIKRMHRRLFEGIEWSTDRVLEQTKQRAAGLGVRVQELARGLDVDDLKGLRGLLEELASSGDDVAPNTRALLEELQLL